MRIQGGAGANYWAVARRGISATSGTAEAAMNNGITYAGKTGLAASLVLPTMSNAQAMAEDFSRQFRQALEDAGLKADPPVTLSLPPDGGDFTVTGDRQDLQQIANLLNSRPDLKTLYHNAAAIASHAHAMEASLKFQQEYRQSSNPAAVVAKYSDLFRPRPPVAITMRVGADGAELLFDGK